MTTHRSVRPLQKGVNSGSGKGGASVGMNYRISSNVILVLFIHNADQIIRKKEINQKRREGKARRDGKITNELFYRE